MKKTRTFIAIRFECWRSIYLSLHVFSRSLRRYRERCEKWNRAEKSRQHRDVAVSPNEMGIECVCDTFLHATAGTISANSFRFGFFSSLLPLSADAVSVVALLTFSKTGTSSMAAAAVAAVVRWLLLLLLFLAVLFHIRSAGYDRIVSLSVSHFVWCKTAWTGAFCVWLRLLQNVMARKMGKTFVQRIKYAFAFISLSLCCVRDAPFSLFTIFLALVSPKIRSFRIFFRLCGALQTTCFDDEIEIFIVCYSSRTELKWNTMPLLVTVSLKCRWMAITFLSRLASASHRKCTMYIPLLLLKYSNVRQSEIDAKLTAQFVPTPAFIHPHKFQFGAVQINY